LVVAVLGHVAVHDEEAAGANGCELVELLAAIARHGHDIGVVKLKQCPRDCESDAATGTCR
jgi:hypothetical protein